MPPRIGSNSIHILPDTGNKSKTCNTNVLPDNEILTKIFEQSNSDNFVILFTKILKINNNLKEGITCESNTALLDNSKVLLTFKFKQKTTHNYEYIVSQLEYTIIKKIFLDENNKINSNSITDIEVLNQLLHHYQIKLSEFGTSVEKYNQNISQFEDLLKSIEDLFFIISKENNINSNLADKYAQLYIDTAKLHMAHQNYQASAKKHQLAGCILAKYTEDPVKIALYYLNTAEEYKQIAPENEKDFTETATIYLKKLSNSDDLALHLAFAQNIIGSCTPS